MQPTAMKTSLLLIRISFLLRNMNIQNDKVYANTSEDPKKVMPQGDGRPSFSLNDSVTTKNYPNEFAYDLGYGFSIINLCFRTLFSYLVFTTFSLTMWYRVVVVCCIKFSLPDGLISLNHQPGYDYGKQNQQTGSNA